MGLLALFRRTPPTASIAKERLRIIVAQERSARGGPDYLPLLRRELLEVIKKYVNVDPEEVQVNFEREAGHDVFEMTVALPVAATATVTVTASKPVTE
jgi:cell division topological specificity factor